MTQVMEPRVAQLVTWCSCLLVICTRLPPCQDGTGCRLIDSFGSAGPMPRWEMLELLLLFVSVRGN